MCKPSTVFPTQGVVAFVLPAPPFVSVLVEGAVHANGQGKCTKGEQALHEGDDVGHRSHSFSG